ncbi:MAG: TetR family transcriptional regulator [Acetobacteraceae bacterium]|nr:TetR family transcriptional regulator [Acetobacteraceae bacterium]
MDAHDIDTKLIDSAFALIAERGWFGLSLGEAARNAGFEPADARARMPDRGAMLACFGRLADQAALEGALTEGPVRDRLFDIVMRRIDFLQAHRAGMLALMRGLQNDPASAVHLTLALRGSMRRMLDAVGVQTSGLSGHLRVQGMALLWLATVRAWTDDHSEDLSHTMAALDTALTRAGQAENTLSDLLCHRRTRAAAMENAPDDTEAAGTVI